MVQGYPIFDFFLTQNGGPRAQKAKNGLKNSLGTAISKKRPLFIEVFLSHAPGYADLGFLTYRLKVTNFRAAFAHIRQYRRFIEGKFEINRPFSGPFPVGGFPHSSTYTSRIKGLKLW